jgi:hypothetical protein
MPIDSRRPASRGTHTTRMSIDASPINEPVQPPGKPAWLRYLPPARWLSEYRASWRPSDLVAGVTLAAYAIP